MAPEVSPSNRATRTLRAVTQPIKRVVDVAKDVKTRLEEEKLVEKARGDLLSEHTAPETKIFRVKELANRGLLKELPTDVMSQAFWILFRKGAENPERGAKDALEFATAFFVNSQHSDRRNFSRLIVPTTHQPNPQVLPFDVYAALFNLGCHFNATQQALIVKWAGIEETRRMAVLENEDLYVRAREMFPRGAVMLDKQTARQIDKIDAFCNQ